MSAFSERYHVRIFDRSGAQLDINNLVREEWDEFRKSHATDDLDFAVSIGPERPQRMKQYQLSSVM